ncbi:hypothetical protein B0H66DRAFT_361682 [Apodospora peruviana]|uniref:Nudix hydrolase domain-containing protein n=1 Tax=Apodospora peruviana TaxID=516989 RepID=A0AAE0HVT7_9PEZI|nr:hypothetical protein B0H66DRAFT_361682 [Apodospora peruviana]
MAGSTMQLEDWLDDLCVRFIINLPREDLSTVARICFQVEEAQWFYEDFIRPLDPTLPSMSLRTFCLRIFQHCPLLASFTVENHMRAFEEFLQYKTRIPVRGAIMLNEAMDSTVLVKGWKKSANWSFPRGKINKDEDDLDCAIREVYEETGFDIKKAGLVPKHEDVKYIEMSMKDQQIRLYVFRNVPMDTVFQPMTRKEISKIQWYKLSELPAFRKKGNQMEDTAAAVNANKFYMVAPFLVPLKKWVVQQRKRDATRLGGLARLPLPVALEEPLTEDDIGTQTEPNEGSLETIPAIETLEGATLELQRLLKVQPPTQGVQMNPSISTNPDKGEALMAILQKKAANVPPQKPQQVEQPQQAQQPSQAQQAYSQIPHTPFDLTYTNPPEPHTPHHHHPTHRLPIPNYQPPPSFPYAANVGRGAHMQHYNYGQAHFQGLHQGRVPNYGHGTNMSHPNQQFRKEPVLLHPQPLPPQVQQSVLVRDILPTPNLPDTTARGSSQAQVQQAHQVSLLKAFVTHNPVPLQSQPQRGNMPPQLTSHKMSLLSAFKKNNGEHTAPSGVSQENLNIQANGQNHNQSVPWTNLVSSQAANPAARFLPPNATAVAPPPQQQHSGNAMAQNLSPIPPAASLPRAQPTDQHRSSLLDMFKKTAPLSPSGSDSTVMPNRQKQGSAPAAKEEINNAAYTPAPSTTGISNGTGATVQMNPELNLPYRTVQILSRPKQAEIAHGKQPVSRSPAQHDVKCQVIVPSPKINSSLNLAENLKDNTINIKPSPRPYQPSLAGGSPYGAYSHLHQANSSSSQNAQLPAATTTGGILHSRRQEANPEQRQKLLSLFGKAAQQDQAAASGGMFEDKVAGKMPMKEPMVYEQVRSGTPRSRVASLASAAGGSGFGGGSGFYAIGENSAPVSARGAGGSAGNPSAPTSRRGSQTPISPADRDFLLSYLQSVSSGAGH